MLSESQQRVIKRFIQSTLEVNEARAALAAAAETKKEAAQELSAAYFEDDSLLPETLVITLSGETYYIEFDSDGDHGHAVTITSGIFVL
jgi:hypothetical protein